MGDLKYVSIRTVDGQTLVGILKDSNQQDHYHLIKPYYFFIDYRDNGKPTVLFQKLNEFSDDESRFIKKSHVLSVNNLSEKYIAIYDEIVSGTYDEPEEPKMLTESNQQIH